MFCVTKRCGECRLSLQTEVTQANFTPKPRLRTIFLVFIHSHCAWVLFSTLLLWEFIYVKLSNCTISKQGLMVKRVCLTKRRIRLQDLHGLSFFSNKNTKKNQSAIFNLSYSLLVEAYWINMDIGGNGTRLAYWLGGTVPFIINMG